MHHSLSLFSNCNSETCLSMSKWVVCLSEALASFIYTSLARVKCLFTGRADFWNWVGKPTFIIFLGLFNICWGWLLILPITLVFWPIRKRGFGPITITDMINPQWGLIQWIIYQIIIRIHFAVTLFQQCPPSSLVQWRIPSTQMCSCVSPPTWAKQIWDSTSPSITC